MKIKKKNTTIPINGKIVDTDNVEDKTSNAPSMRLMEEMMEAKIIWSGNLYVTNSYQILNQALKENKLYIFVVKSLSSSYIEFIPYIYGAGNCLQHSYYDGSTVVRWRIDINSKGTEFVLNTDSLNMSSNTGILAIYEII